MGKLSKGSSEVKYYQYWAEDKYHQQLYYKKVSLKWLSFSMDTKLLKFYFFLFTVGYFGEEQDDFKW